jgi:hypothetical protein
MKYKWYWTPGWWWRLLVMMGLWTIGGFLSKINWIIGLFFFIAGWGFYFVSLAVRQKHIEEKDRENITISNIPKSELIQEGYKYYCTGCGAAYKELSYESVKGQLNTKMCSCGSNSFATLDKDECIRE